MYVCLQKPANKLKVHINGIIYTIYIYCDYIPKSLLILLKMNLSNNGVVMPYLIQYNL